jgi:hypothetical protein
MRFLQSPFHKVFLGGLLVSSILPEVRGTGWFNPTEESRLPPEQWALLNDCLTRVLVEDFLSMDVPEALLSRYTVVSYPWDRQVKIYRDEMDRRYEKFIRAVGWLNRATTPIQKETFRNEVAFLEKAFLRVKKSFETTKRLRQVKTAQAMDSIFFSGERFTKEDAHFRVLSMTERIDSVFTPLEFGRDDGIFNQGLRNVVGLLAPVYGWDKGAMMEIQSELWKSLYGPWQTDPSLTKEILLEAYEYILEEENFYKEVFKEALESEESNLIRWFWSRKSMALSILETVWETLNMYPGTRMEKMISHLSKIFDDIPVMENKKSICPIRCCPKVVQNEKVFEFILGLVLMRCG